MSQTCFICLKHIDTGDVTDIGCEHLYHTVCLKDWCKYSIMSPCCRKKIQIDVSDSWTDDDDDESLTSVDDEYNMCM